MAPSSASVCWVSAGDTSSAETATTYMFQYLPRQFTAENVMLELRRFVRDDGYNFVYVPWVRTGQRNVGYGCVNFVDPQLARDVVSRMNNSSWESCAPGRRVRLELAGCQGLLANLRRYAQLYGVGETVHEHCPVVLSQGRRVSFREALAECERHSPSPDGRVTSSRASCDECPEEAPVESLALTEEVTGETLPSSREQAARGDDISDRGWLGRHQALPGVPTAAGHDQRSAQAPCTGGHGMATGGCGRGASASQCPLESRCSGSSSCELSADASASGSVMSAPADGLGGDVEKLVDLAVLPQNCARMAEMIRSVQSHLRLNG